VRVTGEVTALCCDLQLSQNELPADAVVKPHGLDAGIDLAHTGLERSRLRQLGHEKIRARRPAHRRGVQPCVWITSGPPGSES